MIFLSALVTCDDVYTLTGSEELEWLIKIADSIDHIAKRTYD